MAGFHRQRKRTRRGGRGTVPPEAGRATGGTGEPGVESTGTARSTPGAPDHRRPPSGTAARPASRPTPATIAAAHRDRDAGRPFSRADSGADTDEAAGDVASADPPHGTSAEVSTTAVADPDGATSRESEPPGDREPERGLRGLVGSGASQVGVSAAIRARDAARPRPEDIARAERELVIVRRNWVPREPFRAGGPPRRRHDGAGGR